MRIGGGGWVKFYLRRVQAVLSRVSSVYRMDETTTKEWEVRNSLSSWIPHFLIDEAITAGLIGHFSPPPGQIAVLILYINSCFPFLLSLSLAYTHAQTHSCRGGRICSWYEVKIWHKSSTRDWHVIWKRGDIPVDAKCLMSSSLPKW